MLQYTDTIDNLEQLKRTAENGEEYWRARETHSVLGYFVWGKFEPVITRATSSLRKNNLNPSHHIVQTSNMVGLGSKGHREVKDYFLSRAACRLIAMNGDPSKAEIAAAQAYFVVQTHRAEQNDSIDGDIKRVELREKVTVAFKAVSKVAHNAGVPNDKQSLFHNARYEGLYGMSAREVKSNKGLERGDNPFDFAGPLELSANEFQMNMAADVIEKENMGLS